MAYVNFNNRGKLKILLSNRINYQLQGMVFIVFEIYYCIIQRKSITKSNPLHYSCMIHNFTLLLN